MDDGVPHRYRRTRRRVSLAGVALVARSVVLAVVALTASACSTPPIRESVVPTGATLTATVHGKPIAITAVSDDMRRYAWNGRDALIRLDHRGYRFYGRIGLFSASAGLPGRSPIDQAVLDEAQLHFQNRAAMIKFIRRPRFLPYDFVWNRTGLLVAYGEIPARGQLSVSVYQACLRGKRPSGLPGGSDEAVRLSDAHGRPVTPLPCTNPGPTNNDTP
jgi:hypothetical protein